MSVNLDPPTPVSNADELLKAVQQRPQECLEFLQRINNFSTNAQEMIVSLEQELAVTKSSLDEANVTIADAQANIATGQLCSTNSDPTLPSCPPNPINHNVPLSIPAHPCMEMTSRNFEDG